mmetsp:Transcript_8574/g.18653  ORF Transcript_8574/g.18653 Transcript_8574/m.18653 type:complete len:111 (-) Transcript_8574:51-383(-)
MPSTFWIGYSSATLSVPACALPLAQSFFWYCNFSSLGVGAVLSRSSVTPLKKAWQLLHWLATNLKELTRAESQVSETKKTVSSLSAFKRYWLSCSQRQMLIRQAFECLIK